MGAVLGARGKSHKTECGCPNRFESVEEIHLRRRYCTWYFLTEMELWYKNHLKRRKASLGNTTESLCLLMSTVLEDWKSDLTLAHVVSNFFVIRHILKSAGLCWSILRTRTLQVCLTLPTSLALRLVTFLCSHTSRNVLLGKDLTQDYPSGQSFPLSSMGSVS